MQTTECSPGRASLTADGQGRDNKGAVRPPPACCFQSRCTIILQLTPSHNTHYPSPRASPDTHRPPLHITTIILHRLLHT